MYGLAIGDSLGVPYEFRERNTFKCDGMRGYGTHNQPAGTWSDDTAMSLATLDSLTACNGVVDCEDLLARYRSWLHDGKYTPDRKVFDCGITVSTALRTGHGLGRTWDNGNGSLMRVAPCAFFPLSDDDVRRVSKVTHAHEISMTACAQYVRILKALLCGQPVKTAIQTSGFHFNPNIPRSEVKSGGFVLDTLNAALWCLTNTDCYKDCVLTAVNLGDDTDTTASVAGALAGAAYGFDSIPGEWAETLRGNVLLDEYLSRFSPLPK